MATATPYSITYQQGPNFTATAGAALTAGQRVYFDSAGLAQVAGNTIVGDAVAQEITASGAVGIFRFLNSQGTTVCQAAGTIAAGDTIHAAAAGQVTNSGTDPVVGRAMSAGTAGNPIEVLVNRGQL